jgi:CRP-like cAMP-binding protein
MDEIDILSRVSIFSHLNSRDMRRIARQCRYVSFSAGDVIIREGDTDGTLFVIVKGSVDVIKDYQTPHQRQLHTFGPYAYFGEMALIDDLTRSATVLARQDATVLRLEQWDLRQSIEKYPGVAMELLQMLNRRIRALEKNLAQSLGAFLPICSGCKSIRNDKQEWVPIETYIADHSETEFSHSICPDCSKRFYGEMPTDAVEDG